MHLILFGMPLPEGSAASEFHRRAAVRARVGKEELQAVAGLAFLFRAMTAFNLAADMTNAVYCSGVPHRGPQL